MNPAQLLNPKAFAKEKAKAKATKRTPNYGMFFLVFEFHFAIAFYTHDCLRVKLSGL